jgi:hypothetical protein
MSRHRAPGYDDVINNTRPTGKANGASPVILRRGSDIVIRPYDWLWRHYLARRKLHVLAGAPGTGKTTIVISWLAVMTVGGLWPDGTQAPAGDVMIWSGEDSADDTLVPRLIAAGADTRRVFIIEGTRNPDGTVRAFDPATDIDKLAFAIGEVEQPVAVLIDPVMATIKADKDSHTSGDVRQGLDPVVQLAERYNLAAIGVTHFSKNSQGNAPIDRVLASVAFTAVPRMVFGCVEVAERRGTYRITRVKSNIAPTGGGFEYAQLQMSLTRGELLIPTQCIEWGQELQGSPDQLLGVELVNEESQRLSAAKEWLAKFLTGGPVAKKEIEDAAEAHCHAARTVRRAKAVLGIESFREKIPGPWFWRLPEPPQARDWHDDDASLPEPPDQRAPDDDLSEFLAAVSTALHRHGILRGDVKVVRAQYVQDAYRGAGYGHRLDKAVARGLVLAGEIDDQPMIWLPA